MTILLQNRTTIKSWLADQGYEPADDEDKQFIHELCIAYHVWSLISTRGLDDLGRKPVFVNPVQHYLGQIEFQRIVDSHFAFN